ncbi:MAG: hypothetical protein ABI702_13965 [Burkholderiales bacterium]
MDRLISSAALAAAFVSFALAGCGGGGGSTSAAASPSGGASGPTVQTIQGVTTPNSVSVVTAKNAS